MNLIQKENNHNLTRQFFRYALPAVTGMVVSSLYTVIDGIFVGRGVGELALGAVNIVYPFIMLQIALTMLVAVGGANLYSQKKGRGEDDGANNIFCQCLLLLIGISLLVNLAAVAFSGPVGLLLGADETLLPQVRSYLTWMALAGIAFMPGLGVSIFIRNDGAPGLEMAGTLCGALSNIVLDYLFIMVFGWGVAGAAIASGLGQIISVCIWMTHFRGKKRTLHIRLPRYVRRDVIGILYSGLSSFLMEFSQSAIALSFNLVLMAGLGAPGVAAYSIVMYVCSIFNMVLIGITQGAQPLLSFNHGAGNTENENRIFRLGTISNLVLTCVFYLAVLLFAESLAGLFNTENASLTELAARMMRLYFLGFFPIGVSLMNILYFQTTGREAKSIILSALRCIGFVQLFLLILPDRFGLAGVCLSLLCGELCNCALSIALRFLRRNVPESREKPLTHPLPAHREAGR